MMDMLKDIFLWVMYSSAIGSILIVLISLSKRVVKWRLHIRFYRLVWLIVLARLIIPFAPECSISVLNLAPFEHLIVERASDAEGVEPNMNMMDTGFMDEHAAVDKKNNTVISPKGTHKVEAAQANLLNDRDLILKCTSAVWLLGATIILLTHGIALRRFIKNNGKLQRAVDDSIRKQLVRLSQKLRLKKSISIYSNSTINVPCVCGVLNPVIYLPEDVCELINEKQLEYVLLHELAHIKNKDLILNCVEMAVLIVHWFNPIVWKAVEAMRLDREIACDASVLECIGEEEVVSYGMTLLKLARNFARSGSKIQVASFYETQNGMKRRIMMIQNFKRGSNKISVLSVGACCLIGVAALTNPVAAQNKKEVSKEINQTIVREDNTLNNLMERFKLEVKLPEYLPASINAKRISIRCFDKGMGLSFINPDKKEGTKLLNESISIHCDPKDIEETPIISDPNLCPQKTEKEYEIAGKKVKYTLTERYLGYRTDENKKVIKYDGKCFIYEFKWIDGDLKYSLNGSKSFSEEEDAKDQKEFLPIDEVEKIIASMKSYREIKNPIYHSKDTISFSYPLGNEGLNAFDYTLLGFKPQIKEELLGYKREDISIGNAANRQGDFAGKNVISSFYTKDIDENMHESIGFDQYKALTIFESIRDKGYYETYGNKQIKVESVNVNGKDALKGVNISRNRSGLELGRNTYYLWKDGERLCVLNMSSRGVNNQESEMLNHFMK